MMLEGTATLVTGGSRGIGRATALRLAEAGSDICLTYLSSPHEAGEVAERITAMGRRVLVVRADLSEAADMREVVRAVEEEFGKLDIAISNAAGGGFRKLVDVTEAQLDYAVRINLRATVILAQEARRLFQQATRPRKRLITISSLGGTHVYPSYGLVGAMKGALESMTRHLANELGPEGVNVNCVCPGAVGTDAIAGLAEAEVMLASQRARSLVGARDLKPEDVADVVLALASPLMDWVQGQTIVVDGGATLHA